MTAADVTTLTGALDPLIIVAGIVVLGGASFSPQIARWGITQVKRMLGR